MTIYETIITKYPELVDADFLKLGIILQDDSDGLGAFIVEWSYEHPIPEGLKLGK
jgi:hypothetical protein